ncbi:MipA/OmpV family protein [Allopontixanthobacter sediminis]|uniref:MipA/OmpV family protein n=1 Tax=Allopontixanthobacter sediminis TaxID=1689985 RepID=A0A845B850_9SPHN|nr:MipA/OmpV family protein [Allopontixanthobacter sediminis]MXP45607.1 MipA/OmpV family protein [Allopontixanthobacter sediminis]
MHRRFTSAALASAAICLAAAASGAAAQDSPPPVGPPEAPEETVYDDNWISLGVGAGLGPSYSGSDDYVLFPAPIVQGKVAGIGISPRPAGLALDVIDDAPGSPVNFSFGPSFRMRSDRASRIEDEVVELAGELDRAWEVGVSAGISKPALLNPYDSLSFGVDARWDVAGAHGGMVLEPGVSYFTPLNRGMAAALSVSAEYADDDFNSYYYTVDAAQSAASGLDQYQADAGFNSVGTNLLLAIDLDGNLQNGGISAVLIGGYSRLLGDAKNTPYTSERGSADQFFGAVGIGYTF